MKKISLTLCCVFLIARLFAQTNCSKTHPLFVFPDHAPLTVVKILGHGREFIPLSEHLSKETVLADMTNASLWKKYPDELAELNSLLNIIGFTNGVSSPELTQDKITEVTVPFGSEGNLGGAGKPRHGKEPISYHYSRLEITGSENGVKAWKVTSPTGCFFYILRRCGNAYFEKQSSPTSVVLATNADTTFQPKYVDQTITYTVAKYYVKHYFAIYGTCTNPGPDVSKDPASITTHTIVVSVPEGKVYHAYFNPKTETVTVSPDGAATNKGNIMVEGKPDGKSVTVSGDNAAKIYVDTLVACNPPCGNHFQLGLSGGFLYNTVPDIAERYTHTRAADAHVAGDLYLAYIFNPTWQLGLDVGANTLEYRDDAPYARTSASSALYSGVYLAKPAIPVQLFLKASWGTPKLQTYITGGVGYAIGTGDQIANDGILLTSTPGTGGGFVASIGAGVDYFWSCNWGFGISVKGSYYSISGTSQTYNLFAYPVTAGIRYRFN